MTGRAFGPWSGELRLVLLLDRLHAATRQGRQDWAVEAPLTYRTRAGDRITVPAGFVTDLASIPRPATALFVPSGGYTLAAVVHDWLYATRGSCLWKGHPRGCIRSMPYTRAEADQILLQAMTDLNVGRFTRVVIWAAVRLGGGKGFGH